MRTLLTYDVPFRLWSQILANFVIPQVPKMPQKDRKVVVVGLTRLLSQSTLMHQGALVQSWFVLNCSASHPAHS